MTDSVGQPRIAGGGDVAAARFEAWTRGARAYVLIALLAIAAALPGAFSVPPLDRDESRFAQATTQMLETGDFVRIREQEHARNKKPIGIYWLQAASVSLFSNADARAIWAYRLPSVLGAVIASLATLWAGRSLFEKRAGLFAAALLASSVLLSTEGMIAKTDAMLCGVTTLAMAALAKLYVGRADKVTARVFWIALAMGVLIKGPITPLVAGLTMATLALWERRTAWMAPLLIPSGILLALLLTLPWFVSIQLATHGQFLHDSMGVDLGRKLGGGDEGHAAPPGYYLLLLPFLAFPISTALPSGAAFVWKNARENAKSVASPARFLAAWAAPTWLVFEALPTKLFHYNLPVYPALALAAAAGLVLGSGTEKRRWPRIALFAVAIIALASVGGFVAAQTPNWAPAAVCLATLTMALVIAYTRAPNAIAAAAIAIASSLTLMTITRAVILPSTASWFVSAQASTQLARVGLHPRLSPGAGRLISVGYAEPSFVFLTRTDTILATPQVAAALAQPSAAIIVEGRNRSALESALAARRFMFVPRGAPIDGFNYSNHRTVSLQPGRVAPIAASPR